MALDFTSFHAMSLLNQGPLPCLLGTATPSIPGTTFSILDPSDFATFAEQAELQVTGNGFPIRNGHLLTFYGDGATQLLIGYDNTTTGRTGLHASAFIRNKGMDTNARWSEWAEILDSQNFTTFLGTSQAGNAAQGTWNINITGNAETARYLLPVTSQAAPSPKYSAFQQAQAMLTSYGMSSSNILIWGEQFTDSSWQYTHNNAAVDYMSEGFIGFFLDPSPNTDNIRLNMLINGTYYGSFQGNLTGNATSATRANINTVTNTLAYFTNDIGTFAYTSNIWYLPNVTAELPYMIVDENRTYGTVTGLRIRGRGFMPQSRNRLLYGDAGPQIRFTDEEGPSDTKTGAIIYNRNALLSGFGASFSFVTGYTTNDSTISERSTVIITDGVIAHSQIGIGVEYLSQAYQLEVHGNSYYVGEIKLGEAANATSAYLKFPFESRQHIIWAAQQQSINENITLSNYGIGTYRQGTALWYAIANAPGVNIFTDSNLTLMHNSMVIPHTGNVTGTVGTVTQPVYINQGVITPVSYELNTNVFSSENSSRFAYFKLNVVTEDDENGDPQVVSSSIDLAATTTHLINDTNVSLGSVNVIENYLLYVNGNSLFNGLTTFSGAVIPSTDEGQTLGQSGDNNHWAALFIGANDTYGSPVQPIYWNNGVPIEITYSLNATINTGVENRIAFYSGEHAISSGTIHTNGTYLSNVTNLTVGGDHQTDYLLDVEGATLFHGDVLHNGTVNFANDTTYYVDNSGAARLLRLGLGSADANASYALNIGGNVFINGIHYFGNSTGYYINNSGTAYLNNSTFVDYITIYKNATLQTECAQLNFTVSLDNATGSSYIASYQTPTSSSDNNSLVIVPGGNLFLGGGEGASTIHAAVTTGTGGEDLYLTPDGDIKIYTGADDHTERMVINSAPAVYPSTTGVGDIGTSTNKWNHVYTEYGYNYTELWGDQVQLTDNYINFYATSVNSTTKYTYIQGKQNAIDIRSENNSANTTPTLSYNGNISPSGNNAGSLGASGTRWTKLYVGTADSYGDAWTPVYWNAGVPTGVPVVQKIPFSLANTHKSCKIAHDTMFTADSIVVQIVVISGESNINAPLTWKSAAGYIAINTAEAVSGAVSGYILVIRGKEYAESTFTYTRATTTV